MFLANEAGTPVLSIIAPLEEDGLQELASAFYSNVPDNTFVEIARFSAGPTIPDEEISIISGSEFQATIVLRSNANYNNAILRLRFLDVAQDITIGLDTQTFSITNIPGAVAAVTLRGVNAVSDVINLRDIQIIIDMAQIQFGLQNIDVSIITSADRQGLFIPNVDASTITAENVLVDGRPLTEVLEEKAERIHFHSASEVSVVPPVGMTATNVQEAIDELFLLYSAGFVVSALGYPFGYEQSYMQLANYMEDAKALLVSYLFNNGVYAETTEPLIALVERATMIRV